MPALDPHRRPLWAAGLALVFLLAGCASGPAPAEAPATADSSERTAPADQSPGDDGSNDAPIAVSLPATYPLDEVPLIDGVIISAADAAVLWNVIVVPDAPMDDVPDEAGALLTGQGMTLVGEKDDNRAYQSDLYDVNVNLHDDGTVSYTVRPR